MGRRVLITGIGSFWGGRVAAALEQDEDVEVIVGLGTEAPKLLSPGGFTGKLLSPRNPSTTPTNAAGTEGSAEFA